MSAQLDALLDKTRLADIASNDAIAARVDAAYEAAKSADPYRTREADRVQAVELSRMPGQGFLA
jgi:uncharacterized metal-binding protein